jgi:hypothetical protein
MKRPQWVESGRYDSGNFVSMSTREIGGHQSAWYIHEQSA